MFIVFGTKTRSKTEESGTFNCPKCCTQHEISHNARQHNYQKIKVANYFTLYFIPIFPIETLARYIKCDHCDSEYQQEVLTYIPATKYASMMSYIEQELKSGIPIPMLINKLKEQGIHQRDATYNVERVTQGKITTCQTCHVDFLQGIKKCCLCDEALTP